MWQEEEDSDKAEPEEEVKMEDVEPASEEFKDEWTGVVRTTSREELIERLKRGEAPTWVPNPALKALLAKENQSPHRQQGAGPEGPTAGHHVQKSGFLRTLPDHDHHQTAAPHASDEVERPRSALHSGDFGQMTAQGIPLYRDPFGTPGTSFNGLSARFSPPWASPPRVPTLPRFHSELQRSDVSLKEHIKRARAPSLGSSLSSSFVMRTPTSPLVYSASNAEPDISAHDGAKQLSTSPDKTNRRCTLPPETFRSMQTSPGNTQPPNFSRPLPTPRRETSLPHQTHQPRRSLSSFTYQPASTPQTPTFLRSRRPSISSDVSPSHASMVGSFEESILRGRMSTAPSKPLDFVAQIGVLGKGSCKPSLRCPAHVIVPFPAVFYNYPSAGNARSFADDSPSPYVGNIDLEHSLKPNESRNQNKRQSSPPRDHDTTELDITAPENTPIGRALARDKRQKRRRSRSPRVPVGGCYRVPEQGQLQIVIKNPNKTAVKLFLVPYDLTGMEAGTKTFVRQRSFSAGPIFEKPLSDKPESPPIADPLKDKHVLRYLIHLKFCCPHKDRFYLYENIRVVFANRVPDGKEKLRNEVQLAEPRYSPYKPTRDQLSGTSGAKTSATTVRRRSSGFAFMSDNIDAMDGIVFDGQSNINTQPPLPNASIISFHFTAGSRRPMAKSELSQSAFQMEPMAMPTDLPEQDVADSTENLPPKERVVSPVAGFLPSTSARGSPVPWGTDSGSSSIRSFSPAPVESGEGLLARRLKDLGGHNGTQNGTNWFHD